MVGSAGHLGESNLGADIDGHDFVLRFNDAPDASFEGMEVRHIRTYIRTYIRTFKETYEDTYKPHFNVGPGVLFEGWRCVFAMYGGKGRRECRDM